MQCIRHAGVWHLPLTTFNLLLNYIEGQFVTGSEKTTLMAQIPEMFFVRLTESPINALQFAVCFRGVARSVAKL